MTRPARKAADAAAAAATHEFPEMPLAGTSVKFMGGKIAHGKSKGGWRVWPDAKNVGAEVTVKYGANKSMSFKEACQIILAGQ